MAFCKSRGNEFVILFAFTVSTFSALIHCRSLLHLSETPTTNDEGDIMLSDMSDQERSEQLADFDYPIEDDTISDETSDEGDRTLSDEQFADFENPIDDDAISDETSDEGDETLSDEQFADFENPIDDAISDETSDEGDETLADFDDSVSDLPRSAAETSSDEGDKTLSDMSDQEEFDEQLADFDYPIDDDDVSYRPRSAVETSDEGDKKLSMSDQEGSESEPESSLLQSLQGSEVTEEQFGNSSEGGWAAMSPKLRCGDDLMNLQLFGSGVDQVELCRGSSAPVPLGHLPPDCGLSSPTHGGLVYATPYDGCGVAQQGGNYFMRMLWHGNPVVLSCPMT